MLLKATGRGPGGSESAMSETIWSSLRLAVSFINRPDLKVNIYVYLNNRGSGRVEKN